MPDTLIDGHVSAQQCTRAVDALLAHALKHEAAKAETQLLPGKEQNVWLVVNTKVMHPEKKIKPARISVKHPIVDPRTAPVCLITKDPQREYKDLIAAQGIKFITRVVDIRHLKGKWKPFEARRLLLKENGLFLADERVVPLLPALLGKIFFQAKKQPIPVNITRKDLKGELERAISSTYFHQNQGTCTSIKIGTVSQKPAQVLANLQTALPEIVKHIKGGWDNVQSFFIKTSFSAALPIWQCDLGSDAGGRWDGLLASLSDGSDSDIVEDDEEESEPDEDEHMEVEPAPLLPKAKGKKRAAEEVEEKVEEKPKKRAKGSDDKLKKADAPTAAAKVKGTEQATAAAAPVPAPTTPATASGPAKRRRRKPQAAADAEAAPVPTSAPIPVPTSAPIPAPTPTAAANEPSSDAVIATPAKKEKRKMVRASLAAAATPAKSDKPTPADYKEPVTPATSKQRRASAVDFFEDGTPASAAASKAPAPPNTPADGFAGETPAKAKKRSKGKGNSALVDTPVTFAIAKLAAEGADAVTAAEAPSGKKRRKRKHNDDAVAATSGGGGDKDKDEDESSKTGSAAAEPIAGAEGGAPPEKEKKRKRKHKEKGEEKEGATAAAPPPPTVTSAEIKQKRSAAGVEKKKEKVLTGTGKSASKSAKDSVVGKKSKKL